MDRISLSFMPVCRALVVDFANPTGEGGTHPKLMEWVRDYFHGRIPAPRHCSTPSTHEGGEHGNTSDVTKETPLAGNGVLSMAPDTSTDSTTTTCSYSTGTGSDGPGTGLDPVANSDGYHEPGPNEALAAGGTSEGMSRSSVVVPEDLDYPPLYFQHEGESVHST